MPLPHAAQPAPSRETYTNGFKELVLEFMRRRTLDSHGSFIIPFLKPGLKLLDLGCGPGTITRGLAEKVLPGGEVIGVDKNPAQFQSALVEELPVTFLAMDSYRLDFPDATFDGIFSHALFEHLGEPLTALAECRRVLKPGGFIGLRSPDWDGMVLQPSEPGIEATLAARLALQTRNGGNVYAGRLLGEWLRQAGFTGVQVTATYEIYPETRLIVDHLATQMEEDGQTAHAQTWRTWGEQPHALFAQAWFAATGVKDPSSR